jgi:O-antigen ligase
VRAAIRALLSFEAAFVLFLFAGVFKADPRFAWVPVDLTALFMGVSMGAGGWVVARRGLRVPWAGARTVLLFAVFAAYMGSSLLWSPGPAYGSVKALYTATLVLWALAGAALVVATDETRVRRFLGLLSVFAGWIAVESALALRSAGLAGNLSALGGLYLGLGRALGAGAVVLLAFAVLREGTWPRRAASLLAALALVLVMLLVGGRGPLLGVVLAAGVLAALGWRYSAGHLLLIRRGSVWLVVGLAGAITALAMLVLQGSTAVAAVRRLGALLDSGAGSSTAERLHYYVSAIDLWTGSPLLGRGVGSWPALTYRLDVRGYPHNLVLETLAELGLAGLGLLLAVGISAIAPFRLGPPGRRGFLPVVLLMLLTYVGLNAMVSGDLPDNRFLFTVLGLMTVTTAASSQPPGAPPEAMEVS